MDGDATPGIEALRRLSDLPAAEVARQLAVPADPRGIDAALDALRDGLRATDGPARVERVLGHMQERADELPRRSLAQRSALLVGLLARSSARAHGHVGFDARTVRRLQGDE